MKPVRRRIKRHFGLTVSAKRVAVRSKSPWYYQWGGGALLVLLGYFLAYLQFNGDVDMRVRLDQAVQENQTLNTKLIQVERQLQIEQAMQTSLTKVLNNVQDENMRIKEDLVFYKNMTHGKR